MKNKAHLAQMEQLVMVLVFALAAALCMQVFALAQGLSQQGERRDRAVLTAQSAAEKLKGAGGDFARAAELTGGSWDGAVWNISYDQHWNQTQTEEEGAYRLTVTPKHSGQALLGLAEIMVETAAGEELFSLTAAWQEVEPRETQ